PCNIKLPSTPMIRSSLVFSKEDSIYGWVRKANKAPFYNGKSAMDIMLQGRVVDLYAVASRLNAERGGKA
ncbi:MAG: hypothetical protein LCH30_11175, partial [Proteobacteria bacterium]|nr:hypothetical protein [Pseudomonadota bacterium]